MESIKKYQIVYADPPWSYRDKALAGDRGAGCKYPVMDETEIYWLGRKLEPYLDKNCALFIWVTMPKLNEVFSVISGWGFQYKTVAFTWVKRNKISPSYFMGMGNWTRANAELCLLATRGKPKRIDAGVHSIIDTPIERHSKKPDCTRDRIVRLMGGVIV